MPTTSRDHLVDQVHRLVVVEGGPGVAVIGPRGVGRTTLLRTTASRLSAARWDVRDLADLATHPVDPALRCVVVADDIDRAGPGLLDLLHEALGCASVVVLASAVRASGVPSALRPDLRDLPLMIGVPALEADEVEELARTSVVNALAMTCGDRDTITFTHRTLSSLHRISAGNARAVAELVTASIRSGALVAHHGRYDLAAPWAVTHRLAASAASELADLEPTARELFELLCVAGDMAVHELHNAHPLAAEGIERLVDAGLAHVGGSPEATWLSLTPSPIAYVVGTELSGVRRRTLERIAASVIDQADFSTPTDHVIAEASNGREQLDTALALAEVGELGAAVSAFSAVFNGATDRDDPDTAAWAAWSLGRTALASGAVRTARSWFIEALVLAESCAAVAAAELARDGVTVTDALLGRDASTADSPGHAGPAGGLLDASAHPMLVAERAIAESARLRANGFDLHAAECLQHHIDGACRLSAGPLSILLWELLRLGRVDAVAHRRSLWESPLLDTSAVLGMIRLAGLAALLDADIPALRAIEDEFVRCGALLYAAEVASCAAVLERQGGSARLSARSIERSAKYQRSCERARTPLLVGSVEEALLSPRERSISHLAQQGLPSGEIAARLQLSVRTVSNHLQNVYLKLGVSSRHQLGELFPGN